jgi:hypothetical protein
LAFGKIPTPAWFSTEKGEVAWASVCWIVISLGNDANPTESPVNGAWANVCGLREEKKPVPYWFPVSADPLFGENAAKRLDRPVRKADESPSAVGVGSLD